MLKVKMFVLPPTDNFEGFEKHVNEFMYLKDVKAPVSIASDGKGNVYACVTYEDRAII